jgi:hypothetical protein
LTNQRKDLPGEQGAAIRVSEAHLGKAGGPKSAKGGAGQRRRRDHRQRPCGNPPAIPASVVFTVKATEARTHLRFTGKLKWNEVTLDEQGHPSKVKRYDMQIRATDVAGVPIDTEDSTARMSASVKFDPTRFPVKDAVIITGTTAEFHLTRNHTFIAGDIVVVRGMKPTGYNGTWTVLSAGLTARNFRADIGTSPGASTEGGRVFEDLDRFYVITRELPRPKTWYWQGRVRAVDNEDCAGDWSDWTTPLLPWTGADPAPPVPTGVTLSYDTVERHRFQRLRAKVLWNEVVNFTYPGTAADNEDDVINYEAQLQVSTDGGGSWANSHQSKVRTAKDEDADTTAYAIFSNIKKWPQYRARVRTIDRYNRRSAWSTPTAGGSPSDTTPPPVPASVIGLMQLNSIAIDWNDPTETDTDIVDEDIAYYQVQLAMHGGFASVAKFWRYVVGTRREFHSDNYRTRYWMRVRSVDASGNKSAWVQVGPMRPLKHRGTRRISAAGAIQRKQIDWAQEDFEIAGALGNQAKSTSTTDPMYAWVDGESGDGVLTCQVTTGSVADRIYAGCVFRRLDNDDFLAAVVSDIAGTNGTQIISSIAGTIATLGTNTALVVETETTYDMELTLAGTSIILKVNGVQYNSITSSTHQTQTGVGIFARRDASTFDNGESRWNDFTFLPSGQTEHSVADDFDRIPGSGESALADGLGSVDAQIGAMAFAGTITGGAASDLGIAESGQTWAYVGSWQIEETATPFSLYGNAATLPIFYAEDAPLRTGLNVPEQTDHPTVLKMGLGGQNTDPVQIVLDRPTQIIAWGFANIISEHTSKSNNINFFLPFENTTAGTTAVGRKTTNFGIEDTALWAYDGEFSVNRKQFNFGNTYVLLATSHTAWYDATPDAPVTMSFWWGYSQFGDSSPSQSIQYSIANQKMTILLCYAPDYSSTFSTTRRPRWTRYGTNRVSYRRQEGSS